MVLIPVPSLLIGQALCHMEFPGTISLSPETMQQVYFEAAQCLIQHGFKRILFLNSHAGNQYITRFVVERINQESEAVAREPQPFDRHGGVGETSGGGDVHHRRLERARSTRSHCGTGSASHRGVRRLIRALYPAMEAGPTAGAAMAALPHTRSARAAEERGRSTAIR